MTVRDDCNLGKDVKIYYPELVNLYGCKIGDNTAISPFVEIQEGAIIGKNCKIQSHTFIPTGVTIKDNVFIGHGVMFTNDKNPRATDHNGKMLTNKDWTLQKTVVEKNVSIGSNATILCGLTIGFNAVIGAGSVVTKDIHSDSVVIGNPAKYLIKCVDCEKILVKNNDIYAIFTCNNCQKFKQDD